LHCLFLYTQALAEGQTIAAVNGEPITSEQVEERAATKLYRLRWEIYDTLRTEAEELVDERLLAEEAERRGISIDELLRVEVGQKVQAPTDQEVETYIRENQVTTAGDEGLRSRIAAYLGDRAAIQRKLDFLKELRGKADYQFLLDPPVRPRVQVTTDDDPMKGNPDAPVTVIHFASFSCEICAESARKIERLTEEFPGAVRWVHRDFLNLFDERGLRAAEAGETAHAQGKFWEFHDVAYSLSGDFKQQDLDGMLKQAGIDPSLYEQAHKDARYIVEIKHDIEEGVAAGVTSVPVIFINGRYVSGTFAYEKLRQMVEEELQAAGLDAGKKEASLP
jgi:protein-disulfide isomerase